MPTTKYKRKTLSIDVQFQRLLTQWKNGQSGAGAWFWQHFKPILSRPSEGEKELHLQCQHCSKLFSARNPSRTSLEHLKSGACNAFRRTRAYEELKATTGPLAPRRRTTKRKEIKRLEEETEIRSDGNKVARCVSLFVLESGIPVSLLNHPRLMELYEAIGVRPPSPRELLGSCLDDQFNKICEDNEQRLKKAGLFQIAAEGWRGSEVVIMINFPEGPPAYLKSIPMDPSVDVLDVLSAATDELDSVCDRRNCLGWVTDIRSSDRKALTLAEERYPWMTHIPCQSFAMRALMKDLIKHVKMVSETMEMCQKIIGHFHSRPEAMALMRQRDPGCRLTDMISAPPEIRLASALEVVQRHRSLIQGAAAENPSPTDPTAVACLDLHFWDCVEAVHDLMQPLLETSFEIEHLEPYFSQILDMWLNLQSTLQEWCQRHPDVSNGIVEIFQKRFRKSYHPAMAAAFVLDPAFCVKHDATSFLPEWHRLSPLHQSDAAFVLKKLSPISRSTRVVSELAKWQSKGLPAEFGSVVSERTTEGRSCLSRCVPMALRKTAWTSCLKECEALASVAARLLSFKATARGPVNATSTQLGSMAAVMQSKQKYVVNNARLCHGRKIDERLLDFDLLSDPGLLDIDPAGIEEDGGECNDGSHLYMQQLQLTSMGMLNSTVLSMHPPPLGTMPELPLQASSGEMKEGDAYLMDMQILDEDQDQMKQDTESSEAAQK